MAKDIIIKTISAVLACCAATPALAADQIHQDNESLVRQLKMEFKDAYPENTEPKGQSLSYDLTAASATWGIVPPYQTQVWAYNDTIPGPLIRIKLGDTLIVKLSNKLTQPTTVHWHGVRVPNAMDGVPGVTQPPIQPGDSFTYQFTPKDPGTFWFHPHLNSPEQIERGLHGVLVVEDPKEPAYSRDLVWVLDDWLLTDGAKIHDQFVTGHDLAHDGRWGNVETVNGKYHPSFPVKAGERLRIRLVNVANGRVFVPAFEGLSPKVIAVDGMPVGAPFSLSQFYMAPGNRLDLDVVIPKDAAGRLLTVSNRFGRAPKSLATLEVDTKTVVKTPDFEPLKAAHFPKWTQALAVPLTHEFILNAQRGGDYGITWTIDGKAGHENLAATLPYGKFSRLRFTNKSGRLHPMHLHGQFFKLLAVDGESVEENFWRDTVLIGPKQSVDVGLVPIDRGMWAVHCHILEHAEAGMMSTIKVE
ncbi:MAG: multicopper oxidase family protein [Gammaproteobacteria bacterium]